MVGRGRFRLFPGLETAPAATLADDARRGLSRPPRTIPPKYFYDAHGSELFDAICELDEYYLTRAEQRLLATHVDDILDRTRAVELAELGSGMARKTGLVLGAMARRTPAPRYLPLDIAPEALEASARALLAEHPTLMVDAVVGDFAHDLGRLPAGRGPRLWAFLGSTVGNLDEEQAPALLRGVAEQMREADRFLLGVDRVKDAAVLHAAYDDARGVTAAFNKNVLSVLNRGLGGDFDLDAFDHLAEWNEARARIEIYVVSRRRQRVVLRAIDLVLEIAAGERILTEISRKFTRQSASATLAAGGMTLEHWYEDDEFALALARANRPRSAVDQPV